MKHERPDIHVYHDYRKFLADHLKYLKSREEGFNVARLAELSKISKSYLSMVLNGKRNIAEPFLYKLFPHLQLSEKEQSLLRLLCMMNQAASQDEKLMAIGQIQKLRGYQKHHEKETTVYRYLTHWYYVAIREMSDLPAFELNPKWIQKRLGESLPLSDIEKAIEFLIENGFLNVGTDGKVRPPDKRLECVDEIYGAALAQFHKQIFSVAIDRMRGLTAEEKSLAGHMAALSAGGFEKVKKVLEKTFEEIVKIARDDKDPEAVFYFSLMGFPATKKESGEGVK